MTVWQIVWRKEIIDALRDRRALMSVLIFPVVGPLLVWFLLNSLLDLGEQADDISLPVIGAENSTDLIDFLQQRGITINALEPEPDGIIGEALITRVKNMIASREHDYVLIIPAGFATRVAASRTAALELHFDSSRTTSAPVVSRVQQLIQAWSSEMASLRLVMRGIDPEVVTPVSMQTVDVAAPQARAQPILGMIPLFVIMAAFVSGMGVAVDTTAGERERKSLEPLLVNPVSRFQIVLGKWLAAAAFSVTGLVLVLALNLYVLSLVPLEELGLTVRFGTFEITAIIITTLPLAFFGSSLQIFIGIFARSFKDAQSYLALLTLLPTIPYLYNLFNAQGRELWMSLVPMLGQSMLLTDVLSGRTPDPVDFALAAVAVLLSSLVFAGLAVLMFRRERLIVS